MRKGKSDTKCDKKHGRNKEVDKNDNMKSDNNKCKKGNKSGSKVCLSKLGTPSKTKPKKLIAISKLTKRQVKVKVKVVLTMLIAPTASQRKMILVIVRKQRKK